MHIIRRYRIWILLGVVFILCAAAYIYIPDNSPDGNDMHPELALQSPGFKIYLLDTNTTAPHTSFIQGICTGFSTPTAIPLTGYKTKHDTLIGFVYVGAGLPADTIHIIRRDAINRVSTDTRISTRTYHIGADAYGRDMLSRLILGTRSSLIVGLIAVLVSLLVGVTLGITAGYFRGRWDAVVMWFINVVWSLPTLLIVFGLTLALGKGFWQVFLAVGLTMWVETARVVRAETMSLRTRDYVTAARVAGRRDTGIIIKHILPNVWPIVWVLAANNFAGAMLLESGLSFLGLGIQPPASTLGSLLRENYGFIVTKHAYLAFAPGVVLMILVLLFYQAGVSLKSNNTQDKPTSTP